MFGRHETDTRVPTPAEIAASVRRPNALVAAMEEASLLRQEAEAARQKLIARYAELSQRGGAPLDDPQVVQASRDRDAIAALARRGWPRGGGDDSFAREGGADPRTGRPPGRLRRV